MVYDGTNNIITGLDKAFPMPKFKIGDVVRLDPKQLYPTLGKIISVSDTGLYRVEQMGTEVIDMSESELQSMTGE